MFKKKDGLENNKEKYRKEDDITFFPWNTTAGESKHNIPMTDIRELQPQICMEVPILTFHNF
jgi:hypothetical protein